MGIAPPFSLLKALVPLNGRNQIPVAFGPPLWPPGLVLCPRFPFLQALLSPITQIKIYIPKFILWR